jgi:hypothetical protein
MKEERGKRKGRMEKLRQFSYFSTSERKTIEKFIGTSLFPVSFFIIFFFFFFLLPFFLFSFFFQLVILGGPVKKSVRVYQRNRTKPKLTAGIYLHLPYLPANGARIYQLFFVVFRSFGSNHFDPRTYLLTVPPNNL